MTRATRERLAAARSGPRPTFATVKVRFPEGISLQVSLWVKGLGPGHGQGRACMLLDHFTGNLGGLGSVRHM